MSDACPAAGSTCADSEGRTWTLGPWKSNGIRDWTAGPISTPAALVLENEVGGVDWSANLPDSGHVFPWPNAPSLAAAKDAADAWLLKHTIKSEG